jgi:hypothetical protein
MTKGVKVMLVPYACEVCGGTVVREVPRTPILQVICAPCSEKEHQKGATPMADERKRCPECWVDHSPDECGLPELEWTATK